MLSTRKPEEPNFNFNHVRGSQEAFGEPPWTGPGPWARGPGPSGPNTATKSESPAPRLRPTRFPEEPKKEAPTSLPTGGVIGLSSIGGISGGHHRPRLAVVLSTLDDRRQHGHPSVVPPVPQAVAQLDHGEGRSGCCVGEPRAGGPGGARPSLSSVSTPCLASPRADSAPDRNTGLARHPESEAMIALDTCSIDLY